MTMNIAMVVMAVTVIVSFVAWSSASLKSALILNPYIVRKRGQLHRLFTAGFIHSDSTHLLFNMLTLYFFANDVLRVLGTVRFLLLYLSAIVVAFIPTTVRHARNPNYNSLGASGAVAAVLFSAILLYPGLKVGIVFLPIGVPGILYGVLYLVYSAWHSYRSRDGINHDAHFTGAIYGALLAFVFEPARVEATIRKLL